MGESHPSDRAEDYLRIDTRSSPDAECAVASVRGELDSHTAPLLLRAISDLVTQPPRNRVELELAELTFIDAAGIRCLLQCEEAADRAGVRLHARDATPAVVCILRIVGLADHFDLDQGVGRTGHGHPLDAGEVADLMTGSIRARRQAYDTCRRAEDAVRRRTDLRGTDRRGAVD